MPGARRLPDARVLLSTGFFLVAVAINAHLLQTEGTAPLLPVLLPGLVALALAIVASGAWGRPGARSEGTALAFACGLGFYVAATAQVVTEGIRQGMEREAPRVALLLLIFAFYGLLTLTSHLRRRDDQRVTVFLALGFMVATTMITPRLDSAGSMPVWDVVIAILRSFVFLLLPSVIIHMAALIPRPNPLLGRFPALLPGAYAGGGVLALVALVTNLNAISPFLPWSWTLARAESFVIQINTAAYVVSGGAGLLLLAYSALRDATAQGQRQALVVFCGLLPWTLRISLAMVAPDLLARIPLHELLEPVVILLVPVTFFISIFAFRLFDIGVLVRKSMIYGVTSAVLAPAGYLLWITAGSFASRALGIAPTMWNLSVVLVLLGVAFRPFARRVTGGVDRVFFREKHRLRDLQRVLIPELAGITDLDRACAHIVSRVSESLGLTRAAILIADEKREFFRVRALAGDYQGEAIAKQAVLTRDTLSGWQDLASRRPLRLPLRSGEAASDDELHVMLRLLEARTLVPVAFGRELVGLLVLGETSSGFAFDAEDLSTLEVLAHQVSAMLENVRLFELATRDPLTGLPRRQIFEDRLSLELERSHRAGQLLAVAIADLDNFKRVNDTWGHLVGDQVLRAAARALAAGIRRNDVVARFGGEEFVLLFPEIDADEALGLADRLRLAVAAQTVQAGESTLSVTVSMGVCVVQPGPEATRGDLLLERADAALYEAKRTGKNRVRLVTA